MVNYYNYLIKFSKKWVYYSYLWHPGTGATVNNVSISGRGPVSYSHIFPNDDYFLVSFLNSVIRLYDSKTGQNLQNYSGGHKCKQAISKIRAVFCSTGKKRLIVTGSEDSCVYLYDMETAELVQKLEGHTGKSGRLSHYSKIKFFFYFRHRFKCNLSS